MSTPTTPRERDAFASMLARLDAQLAQDLAPDLAQDLMGRAPPPVPESAEVSAFAPTHASFLDTPPVPGRGLRRWLPWLVGGGLVAGAMSFALSFDGGPAARVAAAAPAASAVVAVAAVAVAPAPVVASAPAASPPVPEAPASAAAPALSAVEALLPAAPAASAPETCPRARLALGLCAVPSP